MSRANWFVTFHTTSREAWCAEVKPDAIDDYFTLRIEMLANGTPAIPLTDVSGDEIVLNSEHLVAIQLHAPEEEIPDCRGDFGLGTECGKCARCLREKNERYRPRL